MARQVGKFGNVIGCVGTGRDEKDVVRRCVENMADVHPQTVE